MTMKRSILLVPLLIAACAEAPASRGEVGRPAPDYAAVTLDGDSVSLASLRGEAVLLNIWATWCPPCRKEMPDLQALHEEFGPRGLKVVGVSIDAAGSDEQVREFLDDYGITYPILRDPGERVATAFATQGVPVTVLIDPDGTVVWRRLGPVSMEDPALREALKRVGVAGGE
jgi:peroxiredoxin